MIKHRPLAFALVCLGVLAAAPQGVAAAAPKDSANVKRAPSPELVRMAREVSPRRIERSVRTLAGFGTRHTLSSQTDPERGIGAARG